MKKATGLLILAFLALLLIGSPITARAQGNATPSQSAILAETQTIRDMLNQAMRLYQSGDHTGAYKLARSAYLDHFENIELPLRARDADLTLDFEYRFANLRNLMQKGSPLSDVQLALQSVNDALNEVDTMLTSSGEIASTLAVVSGFSVIFREGLEAVLVLAALLGYLRASQGQALGRYIFYGVGLAILASVLSWLVVHYLITISPLARELLEAVISLFAVVVLFWVNFWLIRRLDQKRWMEFMKARAWSAMASGSAIGLVILGFTAVYREGLETALFYEALALMSQTVEVYLLLGLAAGIVALGVVSWLILKSSRKLPIQRFFGVTVTLLMILSVAFFGNAVYSLQEVQVIGTTSLIGVLPRLPEVLAQFTGYHPTVETLAAQLLLAVIYVVGWVIMRRQLRIEQQRRKQTPADSLPSQRAASA